MKAAVYNGVAVGTDGGADPIPDKGVLGKVVVTMESAP